MFQIEEATPATLKAKTPRDEKHGDDSVPAITLAWKLRVPNTWLDRLSDGLTELFYQYEDPVQRELDGVPVVSLTKLRTTAVGALEVKNAYLGCTLTVRDGTQPPMVFGDCKVDKFVVAEMMEGGTVEIHIRVGTSDIDAATAGRLVMMTVGSEHTITLQVPPQADAQTPKQQTLEPPAPPPVTPIEALAQAEATAKPKKEKRTRVAAIDKALLDTNARMDKRDGVAIAGTVVPYARPAIDLAADEQRKLDAERKPKKGRTMAQKIARAERDAARATAQKIAKGAA